MDANSYSKLKFYRSNTLETVSTGFIKLVDSSRIGVPLAYLATSREEAMKNSPPNGFYHNLGLLITPEKIREKLVAQSEIDRFYDTLVLSDEAKTFCLALGLAKASMYISSNYDIMVDSVCLIGAFMYTYARSRLLKLNRLGARLLALRTVIVAGSISVLVRYFIYKHNDTREDRFACDLGLDACEGSLEYYDKQIERNKLLRKIIDNGEQLIDANGEQTRVAVQVPHTSFHFYMNAFGKSLSERRQFCEQHLKKTVNRLEQEMSTRTSSAVAQPNEPKAAGRSDKEWEIFRRLRLTIASNKNDDNNKSE